MTQTNEIQNQPAQGASLVIRMLQGAGIALLLIIMFLLSAGEPDPEWPKFWMIKPLIIVPIAGAMGGAFFYFMNRLQFDSSWKKALVIVLSIVGYIIVLWLGTVLGLNGTMWD